MFSLLFNVANICAGILLGISALDKLDGEANFFNKIAGFLSPFNVVIGGTCLGLGVLFLFRGGGIFYDIVSICSGLLLLVSVLIKIPAVGGFLTKIAGKLMPYKVTVGIASLIMGVLNILGLSLF